MNCFKSQAAQTLKQGEHSITAADISKPALQVIHALQSADFEAYAVGGCLRDLLLGKVPKDFDIATNATPYQIIEVFGRQGRIIGRRFPIVHVKYGKELIEVATFRARPAPQRKQLKSSRKQKQHSAGMVLRDNNYGSMMDDFGRRDFTVNALYFQTRTGVLYDFSDAIGDLKAKTLKLIGNPNDRYREDPVRMIRAARFMAKLGFTLDAASRIPIATQSSMLLLVPPARLCGEVCKLFLSGHGCASLASLQDLRLFSILFPESSAAPKEDLDLLRLALRQTDQRVQKNRFTSPALLYAALLWPAYKNRLRQAKVNKSQNKNYIAEDTIAAAKNRLAITKHTGSITFRIWCLQWQLMQIDPKRAGYFSEPPKTLRMACLFLLLRARHEQNDKLYKHAQSWMGRLQALNHSSDHRRSARTKHKPLSRSSKPFKIRQG